MPLLALLLVQAPPAAAQPPDRWGRSVEASSSVLRARLNSYFSPDDYPARADRQEEQGAVRFDLAIGTDGRVSNCLVTRSSGSAVLDRSTCRILTRRLRYQRIDRPGAWRTAAASDRGIVRWTLDPNRPRRPAIEHIPHGWSFPPPAPECVPVVGC